MKCIMMDTIKGKYRLPVEMLLSNIPNHQGVGITITTKSARNTSDVVNIILTLL